MGKKPGGAGAGAGWLATVRKVFKPASKDLRHAKKQRGGEDEASAAAGGDGGEAAEVVSVEHFSAAETSPEVTNEGIGAVVWLEREEDYGEVAGARREHRGVPAAASRVARMAAARGRASAREGRAAVRIQAFYRGYLARRALRALRGLVRLQALVRGHQVRRQVHRTMRCMQALVRAQDRFRARRLVTSPYAGRRAAQRHPTSLLVPGKHGLAHQQHGGRRSFGHDNVGFYDTELHVDHEMQEQGQAPPRRSNVSRCALQETWDDAVRDDGMLLRHDTAAARGETIAPPTYAYEFQHRRRQTEELRNAGSRHCMDGSHAGVQPHQQQHAPEQTNHQHGAAETSYVTAAATDGGASENTVEMEEAVYARKKSPTRDLYPVRPPAIPGYMAATLSARAKARMAPPPPPPAAPRAHARARSGSAASLGWAPESSGSGDQTSPTLGGRSRLPFA